MRLPFDVWFTRALLPLFGILVAVCLLFTASFALVLDALSSSARWHLFFMGLNTFFASAAYGAWVNARPLPARARHITDESLTDEG